MVSLHEKEDDHNTTDERKQYGTEDRYLSEPQKAHLTGEFVIVAKFGCHALSHLASWLANVVRQGGREAGRQTKNLVLTIFKNPYLSFYNCCIVLCTISGFNNVKAVQVRYFSSRSMLIGCFF